MASLYYCCQVWPLSRRLQSGRLADSAACRICLQPQESFLSCCVCSSCSSHTSILPALAVKPWVPSNRTPPPSLSFLPPVSLNCHPPPLVPPLFLCSTGLVKVSPFPSGTTVQIAMFPAQMVAVLLRIHPLRKWLCCSSSFSLLIFCLTVFVHAQLICPYYLVSIPL